MTKKEIEEKLDSLYYDLFILKMQDGWDSSDFERSRELSKEIKALEDQLKELGGNV